MGAILRHLEQAAVLERRERYAGEPRVRPAERAREHRERGSRAALCTAQRLEDGAEPRVLLNQARDEQERQLSTPQLGGVAQPCEWKRVGGGPLPVLNGISPACAVEPGSIELLVVAAEKGEPGTDVRHLAQALAQRQDRGVEPKLEVLLRAVGQAVER